MPKHVSRKVFLRGLIGTGISLSFLNLKPLEFQKKVVSYPMGTNQTPFKQSPLPYSFSDLEPHIDTKTMTIHYTKHAAGYTRKLNNFWQAEVDSNKEKSLQELLLHISSYSSNLRNNAGGHFNHEFFWSILQKPSSFTINNLKIIQDIILQYGNIDEFKKSFAKKAKSVFGSGWCWLIKNKRGKLEICSSPNQDNPLMNVAENQGSPIIGLDVWEHAYYLKYQNKRADYINNFWQVLNWKKINDIYLA